MTSTAGWGSDTMGRPSQEVAARSRAKAGAKGSQHMCSAQPSHVRLLAGLLVTVAVAAVAPAVAAGPGYALLLLLLLPASTTRGMAAPMMSLVEDEDDRDEEEDGT